MAKKAENYESMMSKLEQIVASMDGEKFSLEESMKNYEDGIKLCNKLYKMLNDAESRIKLLTENGEKDLDENSGEEA